MISARLTEHQFRQTVDYLYDGVTQTAHLMGQIRVFKRGDEVLLWLCRNNLRGQRMVDFFKEESDDDNSKGVLRGYETALKFIDGHLKLKFGEKLYLDSLKGEKLYLDRLK